MISPILDPLARVTPRHWPDLPQRWMGSFNALVLAVIGDCRSVAPRWRHRSA